MTKITAFKYSKFGLIIGLVRDWCTHLSFSINRHEYIIAVDNRTIESYPKIAIVCK